LRDVAVSCVLSRPDYTVGIGISPIRRLLLKDRRSRAITAGGDLHPAPKTYLVILMILPYFYFVKLKLDEIYPMIQ